MIGDEEPRAFLWQVFNIINADSINEATEQPHEESNRSLRQQPDDVGKNRKNTDPGQQKDLCRTELQPTTEKPE